MKVLVIDDDQYFTEPLIWELQERGYEVETYGAIEDVLGEDKKIKIGKPDCVVLDIMMPHGEIFTRRETNGGARTGLRLLEIIHREWPDVPVIIVTVRDDLSLYELQEKYGDNIKAILVKPVTPTEVVEMLDEIST